MRWLIVQLNGHEFEQTPGDSGGQRKLACCSLWSFKESDMTYPLNYCGKPNNVLNNAMYQINLNYYFLFKKQQYNNAAKSLQSCPTLCDPIDGSPPGSSVLGILQARTTPNPSEPCLPSSFCPNSLLSSRDMEKLHALLFYEPTPKLSFSSLHCSFCPYHTIH